MLFSTKRLKNSLIIPKSPHKNVKYSITASFLFIINSRRAVSEVDVCCTIGHSALKAGCINVIHKQLVRENSIWGSVLCLREERLW